MKFAETSKSLLLRTHRFWSRALPDSYRLYRFEGGLIYLNIKESHKMLERVLGRYEQAKHQALRHFIRPGMTFVDVGCNKGDFCLTASRLVGSSGRVLAFEPHPENCGWIRKSIAKNGYHNIDLYELALSDSNDTAQLHLGEQSGHHTLLAGQLRHEQGLIEVQTRILDDLLEETKFCGTIDAIKIDVEGADIHVLRGAQKTLLRNHGIVVFLDIHPQLGVDSAEVCAFLRGLGFGLRKEEPPFNLPIDREASLSSLIAIREGSSLLNPELTLPSRLLAQAAD
jgi:FkbM family methyltransferase